MTQAFPWRNQWVYFMGWVSYGPLLPLEIINRAMFPLLTDRGFFNVLQGGFFSVFTLDRLVSSTSLSERRGSLRSVNTLYVYLELHWLHTSLSKHVQLLVRTMVYLGSLFILSVSLTDDLTGLCLCLCRFVLQQWIIEGE